jgi:hypothetical protein
MLIERHHFFLSSARVILDDALLTRLLQEKTYAYITGISHNKLQVDETISIKPKKTILIPLTSGIETISNGFSDTVKNEIRRTHTLEGFSFAIDTDKEASYTLYAEFECMQHRVPQHKESFLQSKIFNAYLHGQLVSAIACYDAKPTLRIRAIYSQRLTTDEKERYKTIGFITKRLVYEICAYGHANGYTGVDMGAVNLTDPAKKGIAQFKSSFGGYIVDEYTYTYKSKLFRFLKLLGF